MRHLLPRGPRLEFSTYRTCGDQYDKSFSLITIFSAQTCYFFFNSLLLRMLWLHCNDVTGSERVCMKKSWSWYALFSSHIKNMFIKQGLVCWETAGEGSRRRERTEVCQMPVYIFYTELSKSQLRRMVKCMGSGFMCLELYPLWAPPLTYWVPLSILLNLPVPQFFLLYKRLTEYLAYLGLLWNINKCTVLGI